MSDLVNALQAQSRGGSVLESIAHPAQVNPLGAYAGAAETAGRIYNVQDQQAQKAWGEALQQSTGPDGVTDYQKASAIAAQNPLAAMGMMKGLRGATEIAGATQDQGVIRNKALTDAMTSALNAPDDQLHGAVVASTQKLVASGALTQEQAHRALLAMPNDPAQLRAQMERNRIALLPPQMQQPAIYGAKGTMTDESGNTVGTSQSPQTGVVTQAQPAGTGPRPGMSPEQRNTIVQVPYPQFLEDGKTPNPNWGRTFPMKMGDLAPLLPQTPPGQGGTKGLPDSLRNPANKATPAAPATTQTTPAQPATPATSIGTGPSSADTEAQKQQAAQNTAGFQAISDQGVASRPRSAILGNMLVDTTKFTTGPLASRVAYVRSLANNFGISVNTEGLSAQESLAKLAAQLANAQGAGSDSRLNTNIQANPHQELSPAGIDLMVRQLQGNEDYIQARSKIAQSAGETNIKDFESKIGAKLDPRAFQFARMTGQQRKDYDKGLSPQDRKAVISSYNYAHDNGLVGN